MSTYIPPYLRNQSSTAAAAPSAPRRLADLAAVANAGGQSNKHKRFYFVHVCSFEGTHVLR